MTHSRVSLQAINEVARLRHDLRTPVNQIIGYCEMLLEDAQEPDFAHRQQACTDALHASRNVTSLIDAGLPADVTVLNAEAVRRLYEAIRDPQARILAAMGSLLLNGKAADSVEYVGDVRRIREAAERLIPTDRRRAEPTSTFEVVTPAFTADYKIPTSPRTHGVARILVVDDIEDNRGVLQRRLQREGHTVVCAESGIQALALALAPEGGYDMILLDVMMPVMDGYETLQQLKAKDQTRDIPVIMISALDELAMIVKCIERGAEDYLPKPFDPVLLRARISACLEKRELRDRERLFIHDVLRVVAAAVDVEKGSYSAGSLAEISLRTDELGTLARVFDSMVVGIHDREERLRGQIDRLREEIAGVSDEPVMSDESSPELLQPGSTIASRFSIERVIGRGGMGVVYLALDTELGERVAIKTLLPEHLTADETAMERFRNEIRLARRIAHRNIVRTHDFGKTEDMYYVTMEFVEGTTLRSVIDRRGTLGGTATLAIAKQLAEALKCAHDEGIIHRDIKPQNLLLDATGTLKVMDFGVARLIQRTSNNLTQVGMVVGTPTYMSPEQLLDENVDARSDLYSAGVVLYECLIGQPPFEGKSPIALISKILSATITPPHELRPDIPRQVSALVMQLLAKDASMRMQSAGALLDQLGTLA